jgi:hypothetical protein
MAEAVHPAAPHHLPFFITAPGEPDILFNVMVVFLVLIILMVGILYFRLHALPEHIAHRTHKVQLEFVAVLCILALFTHNHLFWIAALLLAMVEIPDFSTPLARMADALATMAGRRPPAKEIEVPSPSRAPNHLEQALAKKRA